MSTDVEKLIKSARDILGGFTLGRDDMDAATVGCAILSGNGSIFTGICIHLSCGIGFCAEHAAVAEMLKARESAIDTIVAVSEEGILAPCGRCREMMAQVNPENFDCNVVMPDLTTRKLRDLLPEHWLSKESQS